MNPSPEPLPEPSTELDFTSAAFSLPFGAHHPALRRAADQASATSIESLATALEKATSMHVVSLHPTSVEATTAAIVRARAASGKASGAVIACRGTEVAEIVTPVAHGDTLQAQAALEKQPTAAFVTDVIAVREAVSVAAPTYFRRLRGLCDEHEAPMIIDESRTGFGRTGFLFAFQGEKVIPDFAVVSLELAEDCHGVALLAQAKHRSDVDLSGDHARGCGAALEALNLIESDKLLRHSKDLGKRLKKTAHDILESRRRWCMDSRGRGLVRSISTWEDPTRAIEQCAEEGLIVGKVGRGILLAPPLTITEADLDAGLARLDAVLAR